MRKQKPGIALFRSLEPERIAVALAFRVCLLSSNTHSLSSNQFISLRHCEELATKQSQENPRSPRAFSARDDDGGRRAIIIGETFNNNRGGKHETAKTVDGFGVVRRA